jgi:hypothetical protein
MAHASGMTASVQLDPANRIALPERLCRAAGIGRGQKLKVSATPGRIILEVGVEGRVVRRGKLKLWTGEVPSIPVAEAVEQARHYER